MNAPTDPILNLELIHGQPFNHGSFQVILTWNLLNSRPCMVLLPRGGKQTHDRVIPCIVPMDSAYLWDETVGDPAHSARTSWLFAEIMGLNPNDLHTLIAITAAIREHIGDVLQMPSLSLVGDRDVVADALITDRLTGKQRETEIVDNVQPRG